MTVKFNRIGSRIYACLGKGWIQEIIWLEIEDSMNKNRARKLNDQRCYSRMISILNQRMPDTYGSFIGMNMTSKDDINFVAHEPFFIHHTHSLSFHIVMNIAAIHWTMHEYN